MQVRFPFLSNAGLDQAFQANTSACSGGTNGQLGIPPDNSNRQRPDPLGDFDEFCDKCGEGDDDIDVDEAHLNLRRFNPDWYSG
jgi:hypothetical protein